jgi:membrane dipeptidase
MRRRVSILGATLLGAAWLAPLATAGARAQPRRIGVVDLHVDLPYQLGFHQHPLGDGSGQFRAASLIGAGVAGAVLPLFVPREVGPGGPVLDDFEASYRRVFDAIPRTPPYALPGCREESGRVRTWLSFEGIGPLAADPGAIVGWVARGVRVVGLVHTWDNELATSSGTQPPAASGLTDAGRELARRAWAAGAVVDVSHMSDAATDETVALAVSLGKPAIATHSNARAIADHPRNLTDAQIRGIAKSGGVVGLNFHSPFVRKGRPATLADVVRQAKHLLRVAGADHVAIGSDFEGGIRPARQLEDASRFPRLARALERAGVARGDVQKMFGLNALRVLCGAASSGGA